MSKRFLSLILVAIISMMIAVGSVSASEITDTTKDHLIEVTGKFEEASTTGGTYIGYNINGYDAYPYTFEQGDVLEYEVYLETATPGIGHVEIQGSRLNHVDDEGLEHHDWQFLRMVCNADAERVPYSANADLTSVAYKQWYKRSVPIPKAFEGFTIRHIYLMAECYELPSENEFHYYIKNVRIIGADGQVKQDICSNDTEFIVGQLVEVSDSGTLSMWLNPVDPKSDEAAQEPTAEQPENNAQDGNNVADNTQPQTDGNAPDNLGLKIALGAAIAAVVVLAVVTVVVSKKSKK